MFIPHLIGIINHKLVSYNGINGMFIPHLIGIINHKLVGYNGIMGCSYLTL